LGISLRKTDGICYEIICEAAMEQKSIIPLLPPPSSEQEETVRDSKEQSSPSLYSDETPCSVKDTPPSPGFQTTTNAINPPIQRSNLIRLILRFGMIFLALFSGVIITVSVIVKTEQLMDIGIDKLLLGEVLGGSENISKIANKKTSPSPVILTSPPANEQESVSPVTLDNPSPKETVSEPKSGEIVILSADLSAKEEYGLTLINETPYTPVLTAHSTGVIPNLSEIYDKYGSDAPVVLILHTHATESFAENGTDFTEEAEWRSLDPEKNMLTVGRKLATVLRSRGINVIHCEEMFDSADFTMAYYNASLTIRRLLAEYPSISYILDLHRDSIAYADGESTIRPLFEADGKAYAQMMFVVGTDHGGSGHTGWMDNFNLACRLQSRITENYGNLMRPINLRSASFNQQYTKGSLLIEMGAVGSSLEEACNSAELLGAVLADEIIGTEDVTQTSTDPLPQDFEA